jgi:replicative DNA helicase
MANLRVENEFIQCIVDGKLTFQEILKSNFDTSNLTHNVEIYEWLLTYWQTNQQLPTKELLIVRFPGFIEVEIIDNPSEIVQALKKNTEADRLTNVLNKTNNLLIKNRNASNAINYLQTELERFDDNSEQDVFDLSNEDDAEILVQEYLKEKKELEESGFVGIPTGFGKEMDGWLNGGSKKGDLYGILAPLGVGKTWSSMLIGASALQHGSTPFILALEGTLKKEGYRVLTTATEISNTSLHTATAQEIEIRAAVSVLQRKAQKFGGHFYLALHGNREVYTPSILRQKLIKYKPDIAIVDYLALMGLSNILEKEDWSVISSMSKSLKRTAVSLGIPIWANLQGNRGAVAKEFLEVEDSSYFAMLRDFDVVIGINKSKRHKNLLKVNGAKGRDSKDEFRAIYRTNWDKGIVEFIQYAEDDDGEF